MHSVVGLLRRFRDDERGVFAVFFGLFAIVLIATAGAVVDFTSIELSRTKAQQALDAAALGLQPKIYNTVPPTTASKEALRVQAKALLDERLADTTIATTVSTPTIDTTEGKLRLDASITVKTAFVALIGIPQVTAKVTAEATRKQLNLEVAMVLDNSLSMDQYSRMDELKKAAKCMSDILYNSDDNCTDGVSAANATNANVWLSIVPFTLEVNVGTGYKTATWLDRTGVVSSHASRTSSSTPNIHSNNITNDNFDTNDYDGDTYSGTVSVPVDRIKLMDDLGGVNWGGCVEMRKYPYDTNDAEPEAGTDTMFTPLFAPDEPDTGGYTNNYLSDRPSSCNSSKDLGVWVAIETKTNCTQTWTSNDNNNTKASRWSGCSSTPTSAAQSQKKWDGNNAASVSATMPLSLPDKNGNPNYPTCVDSFPSVPVQTSTGNNPKRYTQKKTVTCNYYFSDRELQERLCKYGTNTATGISQSGIKGPNADCPTNAITPLTATKATITTAIGKLDAQGATNIHAGAIWGFHVLSPTLPFNEGKAYGNATSKVMVIMTDGENRTTGSTNMNKSGWYMPYGYPWNDRLGDVNSDTAALTDAVDSRLVETCVNARAKDITVYTVGLDVDLTADPDGNKKMLEDCANPTEGGRVYAYFPDDATDLTDVFKTIANQLSNLRLAK